MRTRDQERALHAYECVNKVEEPQRKDYASIVKGLPSAVQRNGLSAALAFIERDANKKNSRAKAAKLFLDHLATAEIPGIEGTDGAGLPGSVRALDLPKYMLATREVQKLAIWFRRATQATFGDAAE